jgi:hypothetical protein
MTVRDIVRLSFLNIGVLAEGEDPTASQLQDAITVLNMMLDTWSTEKLFIYSVAEELFPLTPGQQTYAFGPGGDFNSTRPNYVDRASVRINSGTQSQIDIPLVIRDFEEWSNISVKNTTSTWPTQVYVDYANPAVKINFWPIPQLAEYILLYSFKSLSSLSTADAAVVLPPGFSESIMYSLAGRLCPMYGKSVTPEIAALASAAKMNLKIIQTKTMYSRVDDALLSPDRMFNWMTGE